MKNKDLKKGSKSQVSIPNNKIEQNQKSEIIANGGLFLLADFINKWK